MGITPARAGKTAGDRAVSTACRDHPRSCGKDSTGAGLSRPPSGSPPLVRERPERLNNLESRIGITPARAGKTMTLAYGSRTYGDHSRSCGKDQFVKMKVTYCQGSPPLVRERLVICAFIALGVRITPARAGKTYRMIHRGSIYEDHPRSCGKDVLPAVSQITEAGSPPLVRERQ